MTTATPKRVIRVSIRTLWVTMPLATLTITLWVAGLLLPNRPWLVVMILCSILSVAIVAAVSAVLASCHMAIAQAFQAGLLAGQRQQRDQEPKLPPTPGLRVVE